MSLFLLIHVTMLCTLMLWFYASISTHNLGKHVTKAIFEFVSREATSSNRSLCFVFWNMMIWWHMVNGQDVHDGIFLVCRNNHTIRCNPSVLYTQKYAYYNILNPPIFLTMFISKVATFIWTVFVVSVFRNEGTFILTFGKCIYSLQLLLVKFISTQSM